MKTLCCAVLSIHSYTQKQKERNNKRTNKQTSHIYWPLMCNKKKFKSHFVFGNRQCAHIRLNWANKNQLQPTKKKNKMKWSWLRHEIWSGNERLPDWLYGQFYMKPKVLKWNEKQNPKQNCHSLKNNCLLKDIFVLHKIWFEKFESLSFPDLNFWRQNDIIIGNFRYKTVMFTVWMRWIGGLNMRKNCNVVWIKVFRVPRTSAKKCSPPPTFLHFYQQPGHKDEMKRWQ